MIRCYQASLCLALALSLNVGCSVDADDSSPNTSVEPTATEFNAIDGKGDGVAEGIDVDGDGEADFSLPGWDGCTEFAVDEDGDGEIDALDLDCD
ncbi:MAG: hypothetical protein AAGC55_25590, partial [Myxococcota bacterium]